MNLKAAIIRSPSLLNTGGIDTADFALGEPGPWRDEESKQAAQACPCADAMRPTRR